VLLFATHQYTSTCAPVCNTLVHFNMCSCLQHISTLQHVLLFATHQYTSTCAPVCNTSVHFNMCSCLQHISTLQHVLLFATHYQYTSTCAPVCIPRNFLVINVCNQGKNLSSPCISIVKPTRCTIFELIVYHSTCFGRSFRPSSGVQETVHTASGISHTG